MKQPGRHLEMSPNIYKWNNTLLNKLLIREEITSEVEYYIITTYQNVWEIARTVHKKKFIVLNAYIGKTDS